MTTRCYTLKYGCFHNVSSNNSSGEATVFSGHWDRVSIYVIVHTQSVHDCSLFNVMTRPFSIEE